MQEEEVKTLIRSINSLKRQSEAIREKIEERREELANVKSALGSSLGIRSSEMLSAPERIYFSLEALYIEYSNVLDRLTAEIRKFDTIIAMLDPIEQEIVHEMIDGKTSDQIGRVVGYSDRTVKRYKKRILLKLSNL